MKGCLESGGVIGLIRPIRSLGCIDDQVLGDLPRFPPPATRLFRFPAKVWDSIADKGSKD